jgi:TRAP-type mannitol/chloroaromatic compound transport system permease small subunit
MQRILMLLDDLSEWTGRAVAWLTLAMVLVTFAVVVARYVFDLGSVALQESVTYMHAVVFLLGAAYTLRHDRHVRVDIFYQRASVRGRAWVDLLGVILLLVPSCGFILLVSLDYVGASWSMFEGSRDVGGLPLVYFLKTLIPLTAVALLLQGLVMAAKAWRQLRGG